MAATPTAGCCVHQFQLPPSASALCNSVGWSSSPCRAAWCCLAADLVFNSLLAASANGYGLKDVGAMFLTSQQAAGILPPGKHLDEEQEERS